MEKVKVNKACKSLYKNELRLQKKSICWWLVVLAVLMLVNIVVYPLVDSILGSLTAEEKQEMLNMGLSLDFSSVTAYFISECIQTHAVGGVLFACCFGCLALSRDFKHGTAELLYTNALSRKQIVTTKYCALLTTILILNAFLLIIELVAMCIVDFSGINIVPILAFLLFSVLVQIIVASIVFGITLCNPRKFGLGLAVGLPLVLYFVASIAVGLDDGANIAECFSPFSVFYGVTVETPFDVNYLALAVFAILAVVSMCLGLGKNKKLDY